MRLQKFMAECGVASRRRSETLIEEGHVKINGVIITMPGTPVDPEKDQVSVDGQLIGSSIKSYILLNKPKGIVSTLEDPYAEKTVADYMPAGSRLYPVGRLDKDTDGLLLMTNDGELTYRLTHPSCGFSKTYVCKVKGQMRALCLDRLQRGIEIDVNGTTYMTMPAVISLLYHRRGSTSFEITISEGKNRQIRRMCAAVGHEVISLTRIALGEIKDSTLKAGEWRYLTAEEIAYLKGV